jgi:signal transduction histidine kinase
MEGAESFSLLLVDAAGHVALRVGSPLRGEGDEPSAGRDGLTWQEALSRWLASPLPANLPERPTSSAATSKSGQELFIHFIPSPPDLGGGHIILVESRERVLNWRTRRLQTLGTLAASVAHEMNNLLTVILGWLEVVVADEPAGSPRLAHLKNIAEAVENMGNLSNALLNFTRMQPGELRALDITQMAQWVVALVDYALRKDNIELDLDWAPQPVFVRGSEGELCQALLNLIQNARQAMPQGGTLRIATRRDGPWGVLEVRDSGCGIAPEIQERIFDPFFTTRPDDGGTGLGLAVCRETAQRHGGELVMESEPGAGALFRVRIPLAAEPVTVDG